MDPQEQASDQQDESLMNTNKTAILSVSFAFFLVLFVIGFWYLPSKKTSVSEKSSHQAQIVPSVSPIPSMKSERVPGQVIVKFKTGLTDAQINQELQKYNAKVIKQIPALGRSVIAIAPQDEDEILRSLSRDQFVQNSEPDFIRHVLFVPNDSNFAAEWGLANTGQTIKNVKGTAHDDINAEQAWDVTKGTGIKVAVLDTGLDTTHPEFAGKVVGQKIFVTSSIQDNFGHGTHVAGAIAADTNNGQGIAGVCPDCQLLIGKPMDDQGTGQDSNIAQSIIWAADSGAKVINMSEGGPDFSQTEQDAINYAWGKGVVIVGAAGNNGNTQLFYPGAMKNVVSVAATDSNDKRASFSNYGNWVTVAAPGVNIFSTLPTHVFNLQTKEPLKTSYDYLSGTSMATPLASGVIALIWASKYGTSNAAVVQRLYSTVDKITGTGTYWQKGRINAARAVGALDTPTPLPTTPVANTPVPTQGGNPTTPTIVPSFACLGSCATPTAGLTVVPSTVAPSGALSGVPMTSGIPESLSGVPASSGIPGISGIPGGSGVGGGGGIVNLLINLLQLLLQLLGGGGGGGFGSGNGGSFQFNGGGFGIGGMLGSPMQSLFPMMPSFGSGGGGIPGMSGFGGGLPGLGGSGFGGGNGGSFGSGGGGFGF